MDFAAIASALTAVLAPVLPYLLNAGGKVAEEVGKGVTSQSIDFAKSLWNKLQPKVEAEPMAIGAAKDAALEPDNEDARGALRLQLTKLLAQDQTFAEEVKRLLDEGKAAGNVVTVTGDRAVGIGGNVTGSQIITGDGKSSS